MTRRRPQEEAVRDQLRDRPEDAGDERPEDPGAVEDSAAPEPQDDGGEPMAGAVAEAAEPAAAEPAEPEAAERQGPEAAPEPEPLDPVAQAEGQRDEYLELARRTQADFENYRKRVARDVTAAGARAKTGLLRGLLPVLDNLERALRSAQAGETDASLAEGVRLVLADLQGVLAREGVEAIEPAGQPFDPTVHEAISTAAQDGAEPGIVIDVVEKGYRLNETVIRPARVVVSA